MCSQMPACERETHSCCRQKRKFRLGRDLHSIWALPRSVGQPMGANSGDIHCLLSGNSAAVSSMLHMSNAFSRQPTEIKTSLGHCNQETMLL